MIGIGVLAVAIILLVYSLNLPKVASLDDMSTSAVTAESVTSTIGADVTSSSENTKAATTDSNSQNSFSVTDANNETTVGAKVDFPINLNTCTANDLLAIDGIGETRASAIIEYREYLGSYTSVEQLKDIKGIGDSVFAKIEPYVTV